MNAGTHRKDAGALPDGNAFPAELHWAAHPLLDEPPAKSALLIAIILGVSVVASVSFGGIGYGLLSMALLAVALSRYFVPTRYALDGAGAQVSHLGARRQISWAQVRSIGMDAQGVFLSPFSRPHRLAPFRGCFLRFGNNRDEIIRFVRTHVPAGAP